jgi:predicted metal-dependent hydrolase
VGGDVIQIDWSEAYPRNPVRVKETLRVGGPLDLIGPRVVRWLKREARQLLEAETYECAAKIGVSVGDVGIGDPVSRWGSCAASGDIRYSWRLILAPGFVRRAIVAHEVAHRIHMNHSPAFHALAAQLLGDDPRLANRWLRDHGTGLHWFGRQGQGVLVFSP